MLFAKEVLVNSGSRTEKIPVGVHTACEVTSVETGDNYIDFNYRDAEGRVNNKRVWYPDITKINQLPDEDIKAAFNRVTQENLAHIVKHMHIFLTTDEINSFAAPDFVSFAVKAAAMISPKVGNKKVNLKVILDYNGEFTAFGRYPDYVEEHVPGEEPKLKFTTWEKANRTTKKVDEQLAVQNSTTSQLY